MKFRIVKTIATKIFTLLACFSGNKMYPNIKVNGYSRFTQKTTIGDNCHFNGLKVFGKAEVEIGDNFHSGSDCEIITDVHNYQGNDLPYDSTYIVKPVKIGRNVWIGKGVTILGGVSIGEGAIVQAKSVVVSNVEPLSIVGGHPAIKFSERNKQHYWAMINK
ncbi:acyltransferase [Vibrio astriarenae]